MPPVRRRTRLDRAITSSANFHYLFAVIIILFAVITCGLEWRHWSAQREMDQVKQLQEERETLNKEELGAELARARQLREEERQLAQAALLRLEARVDRLIADVDDMATKITAWEEATQSLLTSDAGRAIASDATATRMYHALVHQDRPDPRVVEELRAPLDTFRQTLERAKNAEDSAYQPSPQYLAQLESLEQEIKSTTTIYDEHQRRLELISSSVVESALAADSPTLEFAMAELQRKWDQQQLAVIEEQVSEAREEGAQQLAEAQAEAKRKKDAELALKIQRQAELEAQRLQREREELARQQAEEKRLAALETAMQADMAEIRSLLQPFISHGYTQPRGRKFVDTTEKGPVSLSALRGSGALGDSVEAMQTLYFITGGGTNDRPLGGFPEYFGGASDWRSKQPTVRRAHQLLNQHGEMLVKKGMLAE